MKRLLSFFLAMIMAVTVFMVPMSSSYAEEQSEGQSAEQTKEEKTLSYEMVNVLADNCTYTGDAVEPNVHVTDGDNILRENIDYTIEYINNIDAGDAQVVVTGTGEYTGTVTKTFAIMTADISSADIKLSLTDYYYNKNYRKPAVTVMLGSKAVDSSNYSVKYRDNKYPGTATVTITGKNNFSQTSIEKKFYISRITEYTVKQKNRTSIKLSWSREKNVDGYVLYQKKSGKWRTIKTIKGADNNTYTIKELTPGTSYNFKVRAYKKTSSKTYYGTYKSTLWTNTKPSQVVLSSVKSSPDLSVIVSWKKRNCSGYQVAISRYSDFKNKKTYNVESAKTSYKKIKGLTDGKKYYVKVRAYKSVDGKTTYGSWSKSKKVTASDNGWLTKNGHKYYYVEGKYLTGYQKINGKQYYFSSKGVWQGLSYKMWTKVKDKSSDTKWLIAVSRDSKRVVVYTGSKNNWNPKYYWKCTVGAKSTPTPTGSFKVPSKKTYQYAFGRQQGYMAWYSTKIHGPYLFHSVLYQPGSKTELYDGRLGYAASHGCIRLSLENAKWIQDNIKPGTRVVIY